MSDKEFGSIIQDAIHWKYPNVEISCGETYLSINIYDSSFPKPSIEECDQIIAEYIEHRKKVEYIPKRQEEYNKEGCTHEALNIAMWERIMENRPESSDALQIKRLAIKQRIPKPS